MKLSIKLAGLLGSGAFLVSALPGFYQQVKPTDVASMMNDVLPGISILQSLGFSLAGGIVAGIIGYNIGDILSNPKNKNKRNNKGRNASQPALKPGKAVTGDETFLDDVAAGGPEPEGNALKIETSPVED